MSSAGERLIRLLLETQVAEDEQPDDVRSFINQVIVYLPEDDLREIGQQLVLDDEVQRAIVGTRLIRELPGHRADAAELLDRIWTAETSRDLAWWILLAFGFVPGGRAIEKIHASASDSDPAMRDAATAAITQASGAGLSAQSRDILIRLAHDPDPEVQFSALYEIGAWWAETSDPQLLSELRAAAASTDDRLARTAADALARGTPQGNH